MIDYEMVYWKTRTVADTDSHRDGLEAVARAARAEAIVECAQACEARIDKIEEAEARNPNGRSEYSDGARNEALCCAIDIRALAKGAGKT